MATTPGTVCSGYGLLGVTIVLVAVVSNLLCSFTEKPRSERRAALSSTHTRKKQRSPHPQ